MRFRSVTSGLCLPGKPRYHMVLLSRVCGFAATGEGVVTTDHLCTCIVPVVVPTECKPTECKPMAGTSAGARAETDKRYATCAAQLFGFALSKALVISAV